MRVSGWPRPPLRIYRKRVLHTRDENESPIPLKCYCGFECNTENELRSHVLKVHGARDGDWKGWVSRD